MGLSGVFYEKPPASLWPIIGGLIVSAPLSPASSSSHPHSPSSPLFSLQPHVMSSVFGTVMTDLTQHFKDSYSLSHPRFSSIWQVPATKKALKTGCREPGIH